MQQAVPDTPHGFTFLVHTLPILTHCFDPHGQQRCRCEHSLFSMSGLFAKWSPALVKNPIYSSGRIQTGPGEEGGP